MKRLPIGRSDFATLIRENYIYVDKTKHILNLLREGDMFFLSRPRRFGKSLLVSTFKYLFQGHKELFKDLFIYDKWNWEEKFPVIRLSMTSVEAKQISDINSSLNRLLLYTFEQYNLQQFWQENALAKENLRELLNRICYERKKQVVVLIDEYDAPLLYVLKEEDKFSQIRDYLRSFYKILKDNDNCIRFLFVTGVSKFSHVSLFSGFNNLEDITLDHRYSTICGYTHQEIIDSFPEYLLENEVERNGILSKLQYWYNGYDFSGYKGNSSIYYEEHRKLNCVYNPYDILFYFRRKHFNPYWFETATPTFLIEVIKEQDTPFDLSQIEDYWAEYEELAGWNLENINPITLLFQTGYLTLDRVRNVVRGVQYKLRCPNYEVRISFSKVLMQGYYGLNKRRTLLNYVISKAECLYKGDLESFFEMLKILYAGLPYSVSDIFRY